MALKIVHGRPALAPAQPTSISLPFFKSQLNRLLILSAYQGWAEKGFEDLCKSLEKELPEDCLEMQRALKEVRLGKKKINAGSGGTTFRFLLAFLTTMEGDWELHCSEQMGRRPISDLVDALRDLGSQIEYLEKETAPPLRIRGGKFSNNKLILQECKSSQTISSLLMLGAHLQQGLEVTVSQKIKSYPYLLLTLRLLTQMGANANVEPSTIRIRPKPQNVSRKSTEFPLERDWSAAVFFACYSCIHPNLEIYLPGLSMLDKQADKAICKILKPFGFCAIQQGQGVLMKCTPNKGPFAIVNVDLASHPDLFPCLALCLALKKVEVKFSNWQSLKAKESDRVAATEQLLRPIGWQLQMQGEDLCLKSQTESRSSKNCAVSSFGDHRIIMAASLLATSQDVNIDDLETVKKSFPQFFPEIAKLGYRMESMES